VTVDAGGRERLRARLGRVGAWLTLLGLQPAADERAAAAEIERLGYGALWFGETPVNKEAFAHAAILLAATDRITVATGIAGIYARDASAANSAAHALAEAFSGRFVLGLGVSHAPAVALRGHRYGRPVAAMREYLEGLEAADYRGPAPAEEPPVVLAALRRRMLELARDRTAGAHPYLVTPEHTARARSVLGAGPVLAPEQGVVLETDRSAPARPPASTSPPTCACRTTRTAGARTATATTTSPTAAATGWWTPSSPGATSRRSPRASAHITTQAPTTSASSR
jgi:probable F420-dependent oxidoreductase